MKLVTYAHDGAEQAGVVVGERVFSLESLGLPSNIVDFLALEDAGMEQLSKALQSVRGGVPVSDVKLLPVIPRPPAIFLLAGNYQSHIVEGGGSAVNKDEITPRLFIKPVTSVIGDGDPILIPSVSDTVDYELEIAAVIGKRCKHVPKERAHEVIAGYFVGNDVSVRDWQLRTNTWQIGKSFDTHGPIGPWIVTPDEVGDPHALAIRCWVNGELRQNSNTKHLIFNCFDQIAHLSQAFTLDPGDVIFTGTSGGVGAAMKPMQFLKAGDVVRVEVEKLGYIENRVVPEKAETIIG